MLRPLWVSLRQLVLPAHCAACGSPAPPDRLLPLCEPCGRRLARLLEAKYCGRCGRGAGPYAYDTGGCAACRDRSHPYDAVVRVGPYEEPLRSLILRYKYGRRVELAPLLGRFLAERFALAPWADRVEMVVPVPLHWTRQMRRGFNQAEAVARALVGAAGPRLVGKRLLRVRPTPHQTRLPLSRRAANVHGAFEVRGRHAGLEGKRVLLVDDVMTSGSTLAECARTLRRGGAAAVYAAVVAVAGADESGLW
ncbi:MAG TPA: ComF family protein [Phycisphaerae bacterium]|nr:ComF family protein [Phycisphaerae bacterium]